MSDPKKKNRLVMRVKRDDHRLYLPHSKSCSTSKPSIKAVNDNRNYIQRLADASCQLHRMTYYATRVLETLSWSPRPKRKTRAINRRVETQHLLQVLFLAQLTAELL